jgi:hypothetical protein
MADCITYTLFCDVEGERVAADAEEEMVAASRQVLLFMSIKMCVVVVTFRLWRR